MIYCNKDLIGRTLSAQDGDVGEVADVYFDDHDWTVRYLVVDTGSWLDSRKVLISPATLARAQTADGPLRAQLSRQQVQGSPQIDTHAPVSRQQEALHADYYGYSAYWAGAGLWGMGALPIADPMIDARRVAAIVDHP
ncbi:MAG: PRC-barrel domain-containing protein, partial [Pseudomonadota bacterium]|nr:PRC-barrel domain-containing protein [Pseudomonadota bacterium]